MGNHQFFNDFSRNFITQVKRVLDIDAYVTYNIDNMHQTSNYYTEGVVKSSLNEYVNQKILFDPVGFQHFYDDLKTPVALLNHHCCSLEYQDFLDRWQVTDTAELFFRKRNGQAIFGMSLVREGQHATLSEKEKNILESFYYLSEQYFHHHMDAVDKDLLIQKYQLTKKEVRVVEELFNGLENQIIAERLSCSLATIKTHIQHIYQKTNVKNRQELFCRLLR